MGKLPMYRFLSGLLLSSCSAFAATEPKQARPGDQAPENFAATVAGDVIRADAHQGKIIVATFWATWCAPCRQEIAVLARLRKAVPKAELEIVAINFGETRRTVISASKRLAPYELTVTHDYKNRLSKSLGIRSIPFMMLIDHTGVIKHVYRGFDEGLIDPLVDELNLMLRERSKALKEAAKPALMPQKVESYGRAKTETHSFQGLMTDTPTATKGAVSRDATMKPREAAIAAPASWPLR